MDELLVPQHWGNSPTYHRCEDVRTEDHYETVVVQLRDSEGLRYGRVRMTREAALELAEYLINAARMKEKVMARRRRIGHIDNSPAAEARAMGCEMTMMAVLHESVNGSRQDAPVHDITRQQVYVKVMAALRMHKRLYLDMNEGDSAEFKEYTRDMVTSLPDEIVLHLSDLWDDGLTKACADEYMECLYVLLGLKGEVIRANWNINRNAA